MSAHANKRANHLRFLFIAFCVVEVVLLAFYFSNFNLKDEYFPDPDDFSEEIETEMQKSSSSEDKGIENLTEKERLTRDLEEKNSAFLGLGPDSLRVIP